MKKIVIVGAGPAGLFCAEQLLQHGYDVELYEQGTGVGKKFLVAGNGGLNLTHSEKLETFSTRYTKNEKLFSELLHQFSPQDLRSWCSKLGVKTFIGSSGRVFPTKLTAAEILKKWTEKLKSSSHFKLYLKHKLVAFSPESCHFSRADKKIEVYYDALILALGGGSWEQTGSDGKWVELFKKMGIEVNPLLPMNCGFEREWSNYFKQRIDHVPLKNIGLTFDGYSVVGEAMLTAYGIEGGAIYALSNHIRDQISRLEEATITLDLKPDLSVGEVKKRLSKSRAKDSLTNSLRKHLKLCSTAITLLYELSDREKLRDRDYLAEKIKFLDLVLTRTRPLSEAISTSGGVCFSALHSDFCLKEIPNVYIAGEMLDFEAPTGGYLLQGCFSTAWRIIQSIINK